MFPFTLTKNSASIYIDGQPRLFSVDQPHFDDIVAAIHAGDEQAIRSLVDVRAEVAKYSLGRVQILDNAVMVGGREVSGRLIDRILEMVAMGSEAIDGYVKFLDNLMENPSKKSIDELYLFIEACDLPITPEGNFLAYKRVGNDYMSLYQWSGATPVDNHIGERPSMPRNEVDDERRNLCSNGLHFCSYNYLPSFGIGSGNRVVVVEINPKDVVSIPEDYNNAKGRTCEYHVVGEIEDWEGERITPFFTDEYSESSDDDDNFDPEDEYDEYLFDDEECITDNFEPEDDYDEYMFDSVPEGVTVVIEDNGSISVLAEENVDYDELCAFLDANELDTDKSFRDSLILKDYDEAETDEPVTKKESPNYGRKLTPEKVRKIKALLADGELSYAEIGALPQFSVHRRTIEKIDNEDIWKDVT
jgi:hypothetical protein